jgi:flagellar biosynthetic protein FliR
MSAAPAEIVEMVRGGLWLSFVVFLRVGAMMALTPAFGEQAVPMRLRLGLALAFTLIVAPAAAPAILAAAPALAGSGQGDLAALRLLATEVTAGLVLGLGLRIFVMALQMAGTIAAQASSLAQFFGGAGVDPQPAMAQLLLIGGLALAVMAGLHLRLAEALILSYDLLPPGVFAPAAMLADWGLAQVTRAFGLAFSLAAPFTIAALLYNAALGVINRAMPQLMVAFVGAPALTLGGLLLLFLAAPLMLAVWSQAFDLFLSDPFRARP